MKRPSSFAISSRTGPALLLLVTLLAFGLLLPRLGFYWDDWAKILVARLWNLSDYFRYYAEDRPLSAWTHILFTPLLGTTPLPWQILNLLLRWLSAWGMLWSLNNLWPWARRQNLVAALLFLVYPVFTQQPAAVTFFQQWLQYALFFLSLGAMLQACRPEAHQPGRSKRAFGMLTALALVSMLLQLSVTEYFVPLELVRPLALWFLLASWPAMPRIAPRIKDRALPVLKAWVPYLLALAVYVVWRLFFIRLTGTDPYRANTLYEFIKSPAATFIKVAGVALFDEIRILYQAWAELPAIQTTTATPFMLLSYGLGLAAGALAALYLVFLRAPEAHGDDAKRDPVCLERSWQRQALLLGLLAVLLGPVPAWITGRQVVFDFHSDRYALPAMFGGALILTAGVDWLAQRRVQRAVLAGALIALAVGLHLRVANDYRWIWTDEQRFFWQLSWRAPGLKAPTAIYLEKEPFPNQGLFSSSAALNLIYPQPPGWGAPADPTLPAEQDQQKHLAYWFYTIRPRYNHAPDSYAIQLSSAFRTLKFSGQTPNSLLVHDNLQHGNCLWLLSERDTLNPYLSELVGAFLPISNLEQIDPALAQPNYPPADILGPEPNGTWCYYFEKADLARQQADWNQAAQLYDQAVARKYSMARSGANSPYEWLPFIEGLARVGRVDEAARLTDEAMQLDANYRPMLCRLWKDVGQGEMQQRLECK